MSRGGGQIAFAPQAPAAPHPLQLIAEAVASGFNAYQQAQSQGVQLADARARQADRSARQGGAFEWFSALMNPQPSSGTDGTRARDLSWHREVVLGDAQIGPRLQAAWRLASDASARREDQLAAREELADLYEAATHPEHGALAVAREGRGARARQDAQTQAYTQFFEGQAAAVEADQTIPEPARRARAAALRQVGGLLNLPGFSHQHLNALSGLFDPNRAVDAQRTARGMESDAAYTPPLLRRNGLDPEGQPPIFGAGGQLMGQIHGASESSKNRSAAAARVSVSGPRPSGAPAFGAQSGADLRGRLRDYRRMEVRPGVFQAHSPRDATRLMLADIAATEGLSTHALSQFFNVDAQTVEVARIVAENLARHGNAFDVAGFARSQRVNPKRVDEIARLLPVP